MTAQEVIMKIFSGRYMRSQTEVSALSSATFLSSLIMALFGFNSRVFLLAMYNNIKGRACAFTIHSMSDNQLNWPVMSVHGGSAMRFEMC